MGLGFLAGALLLVGWLIVGGFAQDISPNTGGDEQPVGRYQAVAPRRSGVSRRPDMSQR